MPMESGVIYPSESLFKLQPPGIIPGGSSQYLLSAVYWEAGALSDSEKGVLEEKMNNWKHWLKKEPINYIR